MPRKSMFDLCLEHVLKNEGGWVDHPADRGGETYATFTRAGAAGGSSMSCVAAVLIEEFLTARRYFDLAVNAGVSGAARMLQNALRLLGRETGPIDGVVGPVTTTTSGAGQ